MNKRSFCVLLVVELFAAFLAMGLMFSDLGAIIYLYSAVLFAIVLTPFFLKLKKAEDEAKKAKIRRNILLVTLLPIAIAAVIVVCVVVAMLIYFA